MKLITDPHMINQHLKAELAARARFDRTVRSAMKMVAKLQRQVTGLRSMNCCLREENRLLRQRRPSPAEKTLPQARFKDVRGLPHILLQAPFRDILPLPESLSLREIRNLNRLISRLESLHCKTVADIVARAQEKLNSGHTIWERLRQYKHFGPVFIEILKVSFAHFQIPTEL